MVPIECKVGGSLGRNDSSGLRAFIETHRDVAEVIRGVLLYGGDKAEWLPGDVLALPWGALFPRFEV